MTREEAIHFAKCLKNNWTINFDDLKDFCDMAIEALDANTIQGEWIDRGEDRIIRWQCSACGNRETHIYNYCPECGARMDL